MKLKKVLALLTVTMAMAMTIGMIGCAGQTADGGEAGKETPDMAEMDNQETEKTGEITELKFYEHADNEKLAQELVDAYNAQSDGVKVSLSIIANDDYDDKMKVLLSGGSGVDCFWVRGGSEMRQLANNGALYALDNLIEANNMDTSVYGNIEESFTTNEKTYGLCSSKSCWLLWYNKDLFDASGLDYPINLTWEEYTDLAASLKTDELWGGVVPTWTMNLGASSAGEYLTDEKLEKTRRYADYMEKWYVTDHSHPSVEEMTGSFALSSFFAQGKTYMMLNGDWAFQTFPDYNPQFTWCAAPLPVFEDVESGTTVGSAACFSIAANSKHPEEAFDFIKFCCYSEEGAKIFAENSAVPAYSSEAAIELYKQNVTAPGVEYVFSSNVGLEKGLDNNYDELNTAFNEEITSALVGNFSMDEGFENFKRRREEILSR
ncbi:MAG: sugar ABC transporter substrate-binding protein [Eubacteriales bacterium]|nr:sugar ABC transporter substrate-binding protein [Eubacteriales bacterium]